MSLPLKADHTVCVTHGRVNKCTLTYCIMLKDQLTVDGRYKRHSCSKGLEVFIHLKMKKDNK